MQNQERKTEADKIDLGPFFHPKEYLCFKALQYFQKKENGGYTEEEIRRDMPKFAGAIAELLRAAHLDPLGHYICYGTLEGINPSNAFNTMAYLRAKAKALNAAGGEKSGKLWDAEEVARALKKANFSALEHFLRYAGRGGVEVANGLTAKGEIPLQFTVPEAEKVDVTGLLDDTSSLTLTMSRMEQEKPRGRKTAQSLMHEVKRDPEEFFSAGEYLQFKALQVFQKEVNGGLSPEQIRRALPMYAAEAYRAIRKAGLDPWKHYREYGSFEGVNPSNAFDTVSYLQAKAKALNACGRRNKGQPWDAQAVARAFRNAHISALEHFLLYAGTGPCEVEAGLTEEGQIPEEFRVPDVLHVPPLELPELERAAAPARAQDLPQVPVPVEKTSPQFPGKRAVSLDQGVPSGVAKDIVLKGDGQALPEYYFLSKKAPVPSFMATVGNELWRKSLARRLIMLTVILPGLFIFFYLLFWASSAYISETKFAVRGQNTSQSIEGFSAFFNVPSATQNDSYIVLNYIRSLDMFTALDGELSLREHYSDKKYDFWYRLTAKPTQEDILDFWKWACLVSFDPDTGILEVAVKAFTPDMALAVCQGILKKSEELVNAMNDRARRDALAQSEREVERAEERIRKVRDALHSYREQTVILDPEAVATGLYGLVNKLESEVTQTASELAEAQTFMKQGSPRVKQLESRLQVLRRQLASEKKRLAGKLKDDQSLNDLLSRFQTLALEEEFAQKQLTSAMSSLEAARVRADAQSQYVEAFQRPVLADQSLYPRPVLFSCIYMLCALLLLGLFSLIIAAVREHAGF